MADVVDTPSGRSGEDIAAMQRRQLLSISPVIHTPVI
jgi:hypothetical protein